MADILIDNQTAPTTPAGSKSVIWVDSTSKRESVTDDGGIHRGIFAKNSSTSAQGLLATTEVYLTGSGLKIPSYGMQVGMTFVWYISVAKTAAGVAAPIWTYRIGAAQTTADTSRLALTSGQIQTAAVCDGILTAMVYVPIASAVGTIAGSGGTGPAGFGGGGAGTSGTFDNTGTIAGQFLGLTVTTGTSAAWTVTAVSAVGFI
jgi:hypothetical protein